MFYRKMPLERIKCSRIGAEAAILFCELHEAATANRLRLYQSHWPKIA
jgi:hypothetical protein